jgi:hypothetical protein
MQTIHKQALDNQRLPYACFFTFGDINKQAFISCLLALLPLFAVRRKQGKQAIVRDRRQDKSQFCPFRANKQGKRASNTFVCLLLHLISVLDYLHL